MQNSGRNCIFIGVNTHWGWLNSSKIYNLFWNWKLKKEKRKRKTVYRIWNLENWFTIVKVRHIKEPKKFTQDYSSLDTFELTKEQYEALVQSWDFTPSNRPILQQTDISRIIRKINSDVIGATLIEYMYVYPPSLMPIQVSDSGKSQC